MTQPTLVLTSTKFGSNLKTTLYGAVTPERVAREERTLVYRAEQLSAYKAVDTYRFERMQEYRDTHSSTTVTKRPRRRRMTTQNPYQSGGGGQ